MSIKIINPASSGSTSTASYSPNLIINGGFDIWQRGVSGSVPATSEAYTADRWLINNTSDASINYAQVGGIGDGFPYAWYGGYNFAAGGTTGNFELWQILDSATSYRLVDVNASLSFVAYASGTVTQIGVQFLYNAGTEALPTSTIGSEQFFTVNAVTNTLCQLNGQAIANPFSANGCLGVRIRPTAVSSGNIYDNGNGILVSGFMLTNSNTALNYQDSTSAQTIAACQRFFEKSYNITVNPGSITYSGEHAMAIPGGEPGALTSVFKASKRVAPTTTIYNPETGATGSAAGRTGTGNDIAVAASDIGVSAFSVLTSAVVTDYYVYHWTADSEIY